MPLSADQARSLARDVLRKSENERQVLSRVSAYLRGAHSSVYAPKHATDEYRWLLQRSRVNMMPLVVDVVAQTLYVEGYRPSDGDDNLEQWRHWQANRMDARQSGVHRTALAYGLAYLVVSEGEPYPVWRPVSPTRMTAIYEDRVNDEWPLAAVEYEMVNGQPRAFRMIDDEAIYTFPETEQGEVTATPHGFDRPPVVRFVNKLDLDGEALGEVEPLIPLQDQLNSTTFGLLMAQQYAAFRQRWVTGMSIPEDPSGAPIEGFNAAVNRLWIGEDPDMKFGEFEQTDLKGYLDSREATIRHIATVSQTPPHNLLGQMANLSAEALAAAESGLQRKVMERKTLFGESWEQCFRLSASAAGDVEAAQDESGEVVWRDVESRSLAQVADAYGKLATMLGVPPRALWERIPGVTATDVQRWQAMAAEGDALLNLASVLERQMGDSQAGDRGGDA